MWSTCSLTVARVARCPSCSGSGSKGYRRPTTRVSTVVWGYRPGCSISPFGVSHGKPQRTHEQLQQRGAVVGQLLDLNPYASFFFDDPVNGLWLEYTTRWRQPIVEDCVPQTRHIPAAWVYSNTPQNRARRPRSWADQLAQHEMAMELRSDLHHGHRRMLPTQQHCDELKD
jgi:hypothetical protein